MELVSRRRSPPAPSPAGAPHAFLSVFLGIRFSRFPGRLAPRPAASFRPRRKEIYYAHPLPRSRGFLAFFPGGGASRACFPHMTWDDALLSPFLTHTHSLHKPRKGVRMRCGASRRARTGPTKCSRARLAKRARSLGTPNNCRAESFEAKSAEGVDASLYIVALCHAEIFPAS